MSRLETYEIPSDNLHAFVTRIENLNSRARKLGLEPITFEEVGDRLIEQADGSVYKVIEIELQGERPKLKGWSFAARIEHDVYDEADGKNIIAKSPFCDDIDAIPEEYRTIDPKCDHCQLKRYRKDTYLLVNEKGEWMQVGSTCLKDFTGHKDPHAIASWLELADALKRDLSAPDDMLTGSLGGSKYLDTLTFLAVVSAVIDEHGWVSKGNANRTAGLWPTADVALDVIFDMKDGKKVEIEIADEHEETAREALEWCQDVLGTRSNLNDFEYNLVTLCSREMFDYSKYAGFIAALISVWQRETQKTKKLREQGMTSEHVGEIGDRETFILTPKKVLSFGGIYGEVCMHIFEDENGNVFVWKTGTGMLETGITYEIPGTIAEHSNYNGIPQTIIKNCRGIKVCIPDHAQPAVFNGQGAGHVWKHPEYDNEKSYFHKNWIFVPDSDSKDFYRLHNKQLKEISMDVNELFYVFEILPA